MPHMIQTTMRIPMCLSTLIVLFVLINTLLLSLFPISVEILSSKVKDQGLVTGHWFSGKNLVPSPHNLNSISGGKLKPCFKMLQAEATQDQGCVIWFEDLFISLLMFLLLHSSYSCLKATIPVSGNLQISCFKAIVETWNVPCSHNFLFKVHAPN